MERRHELHDGGQRDARPAGVAGSDRRAPASDFRAPRVVVAVAVDPVAAESGSSNVVDAHKLSHSAAVSRAAGTMCTALTSHTPPPGSVKFTRPALFDR